MKNNTKVRLHLSKQLFESLTREIIKEAKANDGYTVAVKQPKQPKQSKSQATSPEVQKTDAEATMGEAETNVAEGAKESLHKVMADIKKLSKEEKHKLHAALGKHVQEGQINEISSEEIAALIGLLPAVGLSAAFIKDVVANMKAKGLKGASGFKQAAKEVGADAAAHMDKKVGGNRPGQGHGVDTSHTFGPQN
jgi:hypothetical protein